MSGKAHDLRQRITHLALGNEPETGQQRQQQAALTAFLVQLPRTRSALFQPAARSKGRADALVERFVALWRGFGQWLDG